MLKRTLTIGLVAAALASPALAQERGTMELGAYLSRTAYDDNLDINSNFGWGGRVGMFLHPRLAFEFEGGAGKATRPLGLADVNVANTYARLTFVPVKVGRLSVLLGAGLQHSDTEFYESYGAHGLIGAKLAISENAALRVDGIYSDLEGGLGVNRALHVGLSLYRHPAGKTTTVVRNVTAAPSQPMVQRADSVSAAETRRLRLADASLKALRDSLARMPRTGVSSAAELAIMEEVIQFGRDQFSLSDTANRVLDAKVPLFASNPAMRIIIVGYASEPGTAEYNMALGLKRARAARDYLVTKGVNAERIEISTRGEAGLINANAAPNTAANAENRRAQFRLLNASPFLGAPRP